MPRRRGGGWLAGEAQLRGVDFGPAPAGPDSVRRPDRNNTIYADFRIPALIHVHLGWGKDRL